uniref:Uncharacterized protein n=1 Tax=Anguilla anguilla TaxID=7936 RepID=A0A0E9SV49_ANGAN
MPTVSTQQALPVPSTNTPISKWVFFHGTTTHLEN